MSPLVQEMLIRGPFIISSTKPLIGQQLKEAMNKDIKSLKVHYARKFSRTASNEDIFRRILLYSDPVIISIRQLSRIIISSFSREVLRPFKSPTISRQQ